MEPSNARVRLDCSVETVKAMSTSVRYTPLVKMERLVSMWLVAIYVCVRQTGQGKIALKTLMNASMIHATVMEIVQTHLVFTPAPVT